MRCHWNAMAWIADEHQQHRYISIWLSWNGHQVNEIPNGKTLLFDWAMAVDEWSSKRDKKSNRSLPSNTSLWSIHPFAGNSSFWLLLSLYLSPSHTPLHLFKHETCMVLLGSLVLIKLVYRYYIFRYISIRPFHQLIFRILLVRLEHTHQWLVGYCCINGSPNCTEKFIGFP